MFLNIDLYQKIFAGIPNRKLCLEYHTCDDKKFKDFESDNVITI